MKNLFIEAQKKEQKEKIDDYPELCNDEKYEFEEEECDDECHCGLDPAFASWEDVNGMFFNKY